MDTCNKEVVIVTRRVCAQIRGSMEQFQRTGRDAASWYPANGKHGDIFGVNDIFEAGIDSSTATGALRNALIHKITILEQKNDFPLHLGVSISCVPLEESTKSGHKYAATSFSNSHSTYPLVIFEAGDQNEGMEWRTKYPSYNSNNLEKQGILEVTGQPFVFCDKNHPVIDLLRQNSEMLNSDIDKQTLIDDQYYKITRQVFSTCCNTLRAKVLDKQSTRDLNNFSVQISRLGRDDWVSGSNNDEVMQLVPHEIRRSGDAKQITDEVADIMRRPYTYSARIEIQYEMTV